MSGRRGWSVAAAVGLAVLGGAWWQVAQRPFREVARYPGPWTYLRPTATGVLCSRDQGGPEPRRLVCFGWEGRVRWRVIVPASDAAAARRALRPLVPPDDGRVLAYSPHGRLLAAAVYTPAGGRVLYWRDGRLQGDHRFPCRPDGLFDGRSRVALTACDDGRVYACSQAYPTGSVAVFRPGRPVALGRHRTTVPTDPARVRDPCFSRHVNPQGTLCADALWTTRAAAGTVSTEQERARLDVAGAAVQIRVLSRQRVPHAHQDPYAPAHWTLWGTSADTAYWLYKEVTAHPRGARLRVYDPARRATWAVPPTVRAQGEDGMLLAQDGQALLLVRAEGGPWPTLLQRGRAWLAGTSHPAGPPTATLHFTLCQAPGIVRARRARTMPVNGSGALFTGGTAALSPGGRYLAYYDLQRYALHFVRCW